MKESTRKWDNHQITVPGWDKFQHYGDRRPPWIKCHLDLMHRDSYLNLSLSDRGALHGIWMAYAERPQNACSITADMVQRATSMPPGHVQRILKRLEKAGFIEFVLADFNKSASTEVEEEREKSREEKIAPTRNTHWEMIASVMGYRATGPEGKLWGKLAADLDTLNPPVDTELLHTAKRRYQQDMPNATFTAPALVKHYPRLMSTTWQPPRKNGGLTASELLSFGGHHDPTRNSDPSRTHESGIPELDSAT